MAAKGVEDLRRECRSERWVGEELEGFLELELVEIPDAVDEDLVFLWEKA